MGQKNTARNIRQIRSKFGKVQLFTRDTKIINCGNAF